MCVSVDMHVCVCVCVCVYAELGSRLVRFISAVAAALPALLCSAAVPAQHQSNYV